MRQVSEWLSMLLGFLFVIILLAGCIAFAIIAAYAGCKLWGFCG